jgi:hypothetical protein
MSSPESNMYLTLFDRISLANSARLRAMKALNNSNRFGNEYETAKLWVNSVNMRLNGISVTR